MRAKARKKQGGANMKNMTCLVAWVLVAGLAVWPGCATDSTSGGLTEREVGGLTGAGMGAGTGAIIGSATGHAAAGVAIGTPIGLLAGGMIGEGMRQNKEAAKKAAREEVQKQQSAQSQASMTYDRNLSEASKGVEADDAELKYNPKTGQRFPEYYIFDPVSGEKLQPIRVS